MGRNCPSSYKATLQRIQSLGCDQRYKYHCMRNKKEEMVEKCIEISWIQEGKCAVYDTDAQLIDSWKCNSTRGVCPQKQYLSNEVMSYSACVPPYTPSNVTNGSNENTANLPGDGRLSDDEKVKYLVMGIIAVIILAAIAVAIMCLILYRRRRRRPSHGSKSYLDRDEENIKSDNEELIPMTCKDSRNRGWIVKGIDIDSFYKTKTYKHLEKLIDDSAISILIVGEPGSGKSVLGQLLLEKFRRKEKDGKYYNSRHFKCLEDVDKYESQKNTRMIYIVDDCFEDWIQYPDKSTTCMKQLHRIHEKIVMSEGNSLVLTMFKKTFENNLDADQKAQLKTCDMLKIIDLSSDKFCLDITDRTGILEYHRQRSNGKRMDDKDIRRITDRSTQNILSYLSTDTSLEFQFPLSCCLFYLHKDFEEYKEKFFMETKSIIKTFVKKLSEGTHEMKCQYCTLIYVALCGGQVGTQGNQDETLLKEIAKVQKLDVVALEFNFDCCLIRKEKESTCKIVHEEITRLLFTAFGVKYPLLLLEKCDVQVLMRYIRTDDQSKREVYRAMGFLVITDDLYGRLIDRLQGLDVDQVSHALLKNKHFRKKFEVSRKKQRRGNGQKDKLKDFRKETTYQQNPTYFRAMRP